MLAKRVAKMLNHPFISSLYLVALAAALAQAIKPEKDEGFSSTLAWYAIGAIFVLLAAGRLVSANQGLEWFLRQRTVEFGLYGHRQILQAAALILAVAIGCVSLVLGFRSGLFARSSRKVAYTSLLLIIFLAAARLSSMHPIEAALNIKAGPFKIGSIIESILLGVFVIATVSPRAVRLEK